MENKSPLTKLSLLCFFTILYNIFFWKEDLGLNLFLFSNFILVALAYLYQGNLRNNYLAYLLISGTFLVSFAVLYHHSLNSEIAWFISFTATVSCLQDSALRTLWNTWVAFMGNAFISIWNLPKELGKVLSRATSESKNMKTVRRKTGLLFVPIIIFSVFYAIFNVANPIFADYNRQALDAIGQFLETLFIDISFARIVFFLTGFWILSAVIYRWSDEIANVFYLTGTDLIVRKRIKRTEYDSKFQNLDLKNELQIAFLVVISVNLLLLLINAIDIRFLWFGFELSADVKLAELVHEGTYMLIFSILLSMAILLYYFRKNLNFYNKNAWLKKFAYFWLFQNGILLISVLFRCYYYISEYGLAYKRIGVILFLSLTLFGLITFYDKIKNKKSAYYLIHVNSLAAYILLILMSFVNWDNLIVSFNFQHPKFNVANAIDIEFTITRSDSALPIIYANLDKIDSTFKISVYEVEGISYKKINAKEYFKERKKDFLAHQKEISWLSWNVASARTEEALKK